MGLPWLVEIYVSRLQTEWFREVILGETASWVYELDGS